MALILLCGLSFAGKSTLAKGLADGLDARLISLDRINEERGLDGGQGIPLEEWGTTNRIAHERVRDLLTDGRHVVVEDTGSPRFIRDEWRRTADAAGSAFALVWVQITPQLQLQRVRANRDEQGRRDVTDAVLAEHAASFGAPVDENALTIAAEDTNVPEQVSELIRAITALESR